MTELLIFACIYVALALLACIRLGKGPTLADRAVAGDSVDALTCVALLLFSFYTGRGIFLDIALVTAIAGFISMMVIGRYLDRRL